MKRMLSALASASTGKLLWLNLGILVALKLVVPLGGSGIATIAEHVSGFDLDRVIFGTNQQRASAGVPRLVRSGELDRAATMKLDDMVAADYFAHYGPTGAKPWDFIINAGYSYQAAGENLARGFSDPDAMVVAWMNSESHKANMLSPGYSDVGIAGRQTMLDGRDAYVVVLMFARPQGVAAAPVVSIPPSTPQPQVAAVITQSPLPVAPEVISTEPVANRSAAPVEVTLMGDSSTRKAVSSVSGWFATYLIAVLGALLLAVGWIGFRRHLVIGWMAHAVLFLALTSLPSVQRTITGVIF